MKPIKFVILRSQPESVTEFGTLSRRRRGPVLVSRSGMPGSGAALKVETAELTKDDIYDLNREPTVLTIAPAMPMKLHEPMARQDVNSADLPSEVWGIRATRAHESPYRGEGITVAVLDTGIDANHEVFQGVTVVEKDFT
ncbi:MAG: peptidase S8, partial [Desulfobulbaceae bacterium]|nr:peptidase S8 [Desulfobulbaceae bacterium]